MRNIVFVLAFLLLGCGPLKFSGATEPTDHTFRLTDEDIAFAQSDRCLFDGNDLEAAYAWLEERGVRIKVVDRKLWKGTTALRWRLIVDKSFPESGEEEKVTILDHERVHYCQRDQYPNGYDFERAYLHSANRWRFEVQALRQSVRTRKDQGWSTEALQAYIEQRMEHLRNRYALWDIDPLQFEEETRRILSKEL